MHPFGLYLVVTDIQREQGWAGADDRRPAFARVDALPITEPERISRMARLAALIRRRIIRTAGA